MGLQRCFETRLGFGNFGAPRRVFVSFQKQQAILFNDQLPLDMPRPNFWPYHILGIPALWPATATSATTCCFGKTLKTFAHHRWRYQLSVLHGWLKLTPDKLKRALKTFWTYWILFVMRHGKFEDLICPEKPVKGNKYSQTQWMRKQSSQQKQICHIVLINSSLSLNHE